MSVVRVSSYECWDTSISLLWGKTPKVNMVCGKCKYHFSTIFSPIDFRKGHPQIMCPSCKTINYVPIYIK